MGHKTKDSKLPRFLEAMKLVLDDPRSVILTDTELLIAINHELKPKERVSISCFEFWKSPTLNSRSPENQHVDSELVEDFRETLGYARVSQKMNLASGMLDSKNKNQWGSSWLLERKFKDLQLKQNIESVQQPLIQIMASNDTHKELIQNILDGRTIQLEQVKPVEIGFTEIRESEVEPLIDNE